MQGVRAERGWGSHWWASKAGACMCAGLLVTAATLHARPVKAPVCLSRELGVMQPGQMVVELSADGVCHTSHCTHALDPLTGFYQINTTSVLCDIHCEAVGCSSWPVGLAWQIVGALVERLGIRGPSGTLVNSAENGARLGEARNSKSEGLARVGICQREHTVIKHLPMPGTFSALSGCLFVLPPSVEPNYMPGTSTVTSSKG